MTDTKILKAIIEKSGLKLSFIAKGMGISRASLYEKINNKSAFNQYEIRDICSILSIKNPETIQAIFFES